MIEKIGLRQRIVGEFTSGLSAAGDLSAHLPEIDDNQPEMRISPGLAADFEHGLESEIGDSCGCGCGHSRSGSSQDGLLDSCSGCHSHG